MNTQASLIKRAYLLIAFKQCKNPLKLIKESLGNPCACLLRVVICRVSQFGACSPV